MVTLNMMEFRASLSGGGHEIINSNGSIGVDARRRASIGAIVEREYLTRYASRAGTEFGRFNGEPREPLLKPRPDDAGGSSAEVRAKPDV